MNTTMLHHDNERKSSVQVKKYESYYAKVVRKTTSGCILELDVKGEHIPAYTHGTFSVGDILWVTILKVFETRYPLTCVDSVISYTPESVA